MNRESSLSSATGLACPPTKRQKVGTTTTKKKNAFDVMLDSSKLCWPSSHGGGAPSYIEILEIVAKNGWFPWHDNDTNGQNLDYSNLRLLSHDMMKFMDAPSNGAPDFVAIILFLNCKNGFDGYGDEEGFCDYCYTNCDENDGNVECDTCVDPYNYATCPCKKKHRYGPTLIELDPRLNPDVKFYTLTLRERARVLLQLLRKVASNWHEEYYTQYDWDDGEEPDLARVDPNMWHANDVFYNDFKLYNLPFYNFIYQLLFTGWADHDSYGSPGSHSPYRGRLIGDNLGYNDWNGGHNEWFNEMLRSFMTLHKTKEEKTIAFYYWNNEKPDYALSQFQYLPETIRRCVLNCVDHKAEALLGKPIADSIDLYRLIRETYEERKECLSVIQWMPCLRVAAEEFVPLETFEGYNPRHQRYGAKEEADNIDYTNLTWALDGDDTADA